MLLLYPSFVFLTGWLLTVGLKKEAKLAGRHGLGVGTGESKGVMWLVGLWEPQWKWHCGNSCLHRAVLREQQLQGEGIGAPKAHWP